MEKYDVKFKKKFGQNFLKDNNFQNIDFLQNGCIMYENTALCGSRGWSYIGYREPKSKEDLTIYEREVIRLEMSLEEGLKNNPDEIIVFMHYPPISTDCRENKFTELFKKYGVLNYLGTCFDVLHTTGREYIIEDIDGFINARKNI